MTARTAPHTNMDHVELPLTSGDVAEGGHLACVDTATGKAAVGKTSTTLIPIGNFVLKSALTGDDSTLVKIKLFREGRFHWFDNDADSPLTSADVMGNCYIKDTHTVSKTSTSRSLAGRVWKIDSVRGVLVEAGAAVTGPAGAATSAVQSTASRTTLRAIAAAARADGMLVMCRDDGSLWRFVAASTLTTDTAAELANEPDAGTGCWIRADKTFVMKVPVAFGMVDGDTIETVPEGFALRLLGIPYWENTTSWTGGSSSAIGISSNKTGFTAAGAVLGGASGDVAATLVAGIAPGTIGTGFDSLAELHAALFEEGDTLTYEEITSAFTAGAGFVCLPVAVATAPATP